MINLKSFLISLWVNVKSTANKAKNFVIDFSKYVKIDRNERDAKECISRAKNAYLALTYTSAPNSVTPRYIEQLVRTCHTKEEFMNGLERANVGYDELYCFLLFISVLEVYKSNEPPQLSSGIKPLLK